MILSRSRYKPKFKFFFVCQPIFSGMLSSANVKTLNRSLSFNRAKKTAFCHFILKFLTLPFEKILHERRLLMFFKMLRFHHYPNYLEFLLERGSSLRTSLIQIPEPSSSQSHKFSVRVAITEWNKVDVAYPCTDISRFKRLLHTSP